MNAARRIALVLSLSFAAACGGGAAGSSSHQVARINAAPMPEGEVWMGVYYHPIYGYLHLMEQGDSVVGRWKRADQSAWGELSGSRAGNLLRFSWTEHKIGQVGPAATSKGKGVFQYVMGEAVGELKGQYGLGDDETGSDWNCVKQQRMLPDLKSIGGDSSAVSAPAVEGQGWK